MLSSPINIRVIGDFLQKGRVGNEIASPNHGSRAGRFDPFVVVHLNYIARTELEKNVNERLGLHATTLYKLQRNKVSQIECSTYFAAHQSNLKFLEVL